METIKTTRGKLIYVLDRGKQIPINESGKLVVDFLNLPTGTVLEMECGFLGQNGISLHKVRFRIEGHQKEKHVIMKVDKRRRDAKRKGHCAFFTVIQMEAANGN
jgi:ribosomal protein L21